MAELKINDFGNARFSIRKKGVTVPFDLYGTIVDLDAKYLIFRDNDSYDYLVSRSKFEFEKCELKII